MDNIEKWLPIKGYEKRYLISSKGNVYSLLKQKMRKLSPDADGYLLVSLHGKVKIKMAKVHRLVLESFGSACPDRYQCSHLNGNRKDNNLGNLKWETAKENNGHKILHGTSNTGDKNGMRRYPERAHCTKLNKKQVVAIRYLYDNDKLSLTLLSREYGVAINTIHSIVKRQTWKHL